MPKSRRTFTNWPGHRVVVGVGEDRLQFHRRGCGVDLVVEDLQRSFGENGEVIAIQGKDLERLFLLHGVTYASQILLRQRENHGDRLDLVDREHPGRVGAPHDVPRIHQPNANASGDRRRDARVIELGCALSTDAWSAATSAVQLLHGILLRVVSLLIDDAVLQQDCVPPEDDSSRSQAVPRLALSWPRPDRVAPDKCEGSICASKSPFCTVLPLLKTRLAAARRRHARGSLRCYTPAPCQAHSDRLENHGAPPGRSPQGRVRATRSRAWRPSRVPASVVRIFQTKRPPPIKPSRITQRAIRKKELIGDGRHPQRDIRESACEDRTSFPTIPD